MSRSYKHTPISKQRNDQFMKAKATKALRNHKDELANGNAYKRLFCSWNICDWSFQTSFADFYKHSFELAKLKYPNKSKEELDTIIKNEYRKWYLQK